MLARGQVFYLRRKARTDCEFYHHHGDHLKGEKRKVPIFGKGKCKLLANLRKSELRLRLHVSRYQDIWISGCQRSGYLRSVYTCRIETFLAFTRVQTSRMHFTAAYSLCVGETRNRLFFWSTCMPSNSLPFFSSLFVDVCWPGEKVKILFGKFSYRL